MFTFLFQLRYNKYIDARHKTIGGYSIRMNIIEKLSILSSKSRYKGLFLLLLRSEDYVNSQTLAQDLHVSSRTIKNDLLQLRDELGKVNITILAKPSHGYKLYIENENDEKQIKDYFKIYQLTTIDNDFDTKVQYILRRLLLSNQPIKIDTLKEELYISYSSSLNKEINAIKTLLSNFSLTLKSKPHHGLSIHGKSYQKIMLCIRLYKIYDQNDLEPSGINDFDKLFTCSVRNQIKASFVKAITSSRLVFSDIHAERFVMYLIFFSNQKIKNLELPTLDFSYTETDEHAFVIELIERLKIRYNVFDFSEEIVQFLTYIAIMSTDLYRFKDCSYEHYNSLYTKSVIIRNYLIEHISSYLQVDFFEDYTCIKDLLKIVIPISIKIELNVSDDLDFGFFDIKSNTESPILSQYINKLEADFYTQYSYHLSFREKHLLLSIFEGVIHRINPYQKKLKLAIIAVNGRLGTQQLKFNLKHYFGQYIEKIETKVLYELDSRDDWDFDYYLCSSYGKNMNIPFKPIYYADENVIESEYVDSLSEVFYQSLGYDETLPELEKEFISPQHRFGEFPLSLHFYPNHTYEEIHIDEMNDIQIFYCLNSEIESIKVFIFENEDDFTMHGTKCFLFISLDIQNNRQKLKMILSIIKSITTNQQAFLELCHDQNRQCDYKEIIRL